MKGEGNKSFSVSFHKDTSANTYEKGRWLRYIISYWVEIKWCVRNIGVDSVKSKIEQDQLSIHQKYKIK